MALILKKPDAKINPDVPFTPDTAKDTKAPTPTQPHQAPAQKGTTLSFVKKGKQAQEAMEREERKSEHSKNDVYRFWVPKDKTTTLTFLDGDLVDGMLDIPFLYEHNVNMNGSWNNWFICTQDSEPCPICEGGGKPYYAGFLTVIDHSEYTSKKDGKVHKDNIKLFVAKRETIKQLQMMAVKRGGLRGCTFDVARTGDKSASVGNVFDFTEKLTNQQLVAKYKGKDFDKSKPIDYNKLFTEMYMDAKELRKLGFGSMSGPVGGESGVDDADYSSNL